MEGQPRVKIQRPDGEYIMNLGLYNVGDIVQFLWKYKVEVVYEIPQTPKKTR